MKKNPIWVLTTVLGLGVLIVASIVAVLLLFQDVKEKLGLFWAIVLLVTIPLGALFGQAKDVASSLDHSGSVFQDLGLAIKKAYTSNEYGAAFLYRCLEWGMLAIAAVLVSKLFAS